MWARRDDSLRRVAVLGYSDIDLALHRLPGLLAPLQRHEAGSGRRGARVGDLTYLAVVWWAGVVISLIFYGFSVPLTHLLDASNQYNDIGFFKENEMPINGISSTRLLADGWLNSWVRLLAGLDKLTKTAPLAIIAIFATLSVVLDVVVGDTLNVNEYILHLVSRFSGGMHLFVHALAGKTLTLNIMANDAIDSVTEDTPHLVSRLHSGMQLFVNALAGKTIIPDVVANDSIHQVKPNTLRFVSRLHGGAQLFAHTCAGKTIAMDVVVEESSYCMKGFRDS